MPVPSCLTDEDLKATLRKHGVKPGPITGEGYEKIFKHLLIFFSHWKKVFIHNIQMVFRSI